MKILLAVVILNIGLCSIAFGWADLGHSIVGQVAEDAIKPKTKDFMRGVLGVEPFAAAAVWPDHVRDDKRFKDFAGFHFCEIPTGSTYDTKPKKDTRDCYGAIVNATKVLKDASTGRDEKIIAARYLIHVMGDIHQPLHVGNDHDAGGNACTVIWHGGNLNFHTFWDDDIVRFLGLNYEDKSNPPAKYLGDFMTSLHRVRPEMFTADAETEAAKGTVKDWLQESVVIRESGLYPDKPENIKDVAPDDLWQHRPYCSAKKGDSVTPNELSLEYAQKYSKIAETQLIKAGLRLAATLDAIADEALKSAATPVLTDKQQTDILDAIQKALEN